MDEKIPGSISVRGAEAQEAWREKKEAERRKTPGWTPEAYNAYLDELEPTVMYLTQQVGWHVLRGQPEEKVGRVETDFSAGSRRRTDSSSCWCPHENYY